MVTVKTKEELVQRIYKYFEEINEDPVVYHRKYKLEEIDPSEKVVLPPDSHLGRPFLAVPYLCHNILIEFRFMTDQKNTSLVLFQCTF